MCDQLGISEQEMGNHLNNTRWVGLIGDSLYTDYLRQGKIDNFYFVTVTMENPTNATKSSSPIDEGSTDIMDDEDFRTTRNTKSPWQTLRDEICGINSSLSTTASTNTTRKRKRSKEKTQMKKAVHDADKINMFDSNELSSNYGTTVPVHSSKKEVHMTNVYLTDYWHSTQAETLFGKFEEEKNAREAVNNQITLLKLATETAKGYQSIIVPSSDEKDKEDMLKNLSEYSIFFIRQKCNLILLALNIALSIKSGIPNWQEIISLHTTLCLPELITHPQYLKRRSKR